VKSFLIIGGILQESVKSFLIIGGIIKLFVFWDEWIFEEAPL